MASSTLSASTAFTTRAPVASRRSSSSRPARALRVLAAQNKQTQAQAPKDAILKAFGAAAAAQLLMSGAAMADLLPKTAESGAARDALNERTSNLPSFSDVGAALKKNLGQNDPKDIGRAIDANTPDTPDLTKNPKEIGQDIKRGAQKVVGDLSDLPSPKQAINEAKKTAKNLGNDIGANLGGSNAADKVGSKAKNAANSADKKVKNAFNDLGDLPNPKQAINDAKKTAKNLGNDIGANLGGSNAADKLGSKAKNAANSADKKVKNAVDGLSDLPELPNPFKGSADPENVAKDAKNKAGSLGNDIARNVPTKEDFRGLGGGLGGGAQDAGGKVKRAAEKVGEALPGTGGRSFPSTNAVDGLSDLPELPNPFKGSADPENVAKDAKNKVGSLGKDIARNVPTKEDVPNLGGGLGGLGGDAQDAGGKVKRAAEKVGDALPGTGGRSFPQTN